MGLLARIKARYSPRQVIASTVKPLAGSGSRGVEHPPFSLDRSIKHYHRWAYVASNIVANTCAAAPLRLYVRKADKVEKSLFKSRPVKDARRAYLMGKMNHKPSAGVLRKVAALGDDLEEVTEAHPALEVLAKANDFENGFDQNRLRWVYLQMTGNAYMHPVIDRALGVPSQVWLLPPQHVEVQPDRTRFIRGYVYGTHEDNKREFKPDEVIHWKLPNPQNPYYGIGPAQAAWSALGLSDSKRVTDQANMENRGRPDWLLIAKQGATGEALKRFEQNVARQLRGERKSGKVLTVTGDVSAQQLNFPPDEHGDQEPVLWEIASCFGVPVNMLMGNQAVSGGATEAGSVTFMRGTIHPYLCMDEQKLNEKWLPLFGIGDDAVLAYDNPVPQDRAQLETENNAKTQTARLTINEAREADGLEPMEGGDDLRYRGKTLDSIDNPPEPMAGDDSKIGPGSESDANSAGLDDTNPVNDQKRHEPVTVNVFAATDKATVYGDDRPDHSARARVLGWDYEP